VRPLSKYTPNRDANSSFVGFTGYGVDLLKPNQEIATTTVTDIQKGAENACGAHVDFDGTGLKETCEGNALQAVYEVRARLETKDGKAYAVTLTRNICKESLINIMAGTPPTISSYKDGTDDNKDARQTPDIDISADDDDNGAQGASTPNTPAKSAVPATSGKQTTKAPSNGGDDQPF
jgi:hypothetical protein